jgi:hypothetical protein
MQIPKQPRVKSLPAESRQPESEPADQQKAASVTPQALNEQLQQSYRAYAENINAANLHAQKEYAKACLTYLEALHGQSAKSAPDATLEFWRDLLHAYDDRQGAAVANQKFAMASVDQQAASQKALADAAMAYSQSARSIWDKLLGDVQQHNSEIADSLKDALMRMDVSTGDIPALSALYQGMRTMSATPSDDAAKSA